MWRHQDCGVLNCDNMYMVIRSKTGIGRNLLPPSLGQKSGMQTAAKHCYWIWYLVGHAS